MTAMVTGDTACALEGRRERKKQRTREALTGAAFELFAQKGFDATTVEEIADAVDVSSRTFFRYFSSKEDVALTFQEEQLEGILAALAARPASEPVVTALRRSVVGIAEACEQGELGFDPTRFDCIQAMIASSPGLMAHSLELSQKKQAALTRVIALRMGVDPATDMRPHVVAAMGVCCFHAVADMWQNPAQPYAKLSEAVDAAFAIVEDGINFPSLRQ
jgi:AcrR family transcriptional regulator